MPKPTCAKKPESEPLGRPQDQGSVSASNGSPKRSIDEALRRSRRPRRLGRKLEELLRRKARTVPGRATITMRTGKLLRYGMRAWDSTTRRCSAVLDRLMHEGKNDNRKTTRTDMKSNRDLQPKLLLPRRQTLHRCGTTARKHGLDQTERIFRSSPAPSASTTNEASRVEPAAVSGQATAPSG